MLWLLSSPLKGLYLAHCCAIRICVYYPFAISLSSLHQLALSVQYVLDRLGSASLRGNMQNQC